MCVCVSLAYPPLPQIFHWVFENKVFHRNKKINCSFSQHIPLQPDRRDYGKQSGREETTAVRGLERMERRRDLGHYGDQSRTGFNAMPGPALTCPTASAVSPRGRCSWQPRAQVHLPGTSRIGAPSQSHLTERDGACRAAEQRGAWWDR